MTRDDIHKLLGGYATGTLTPEEEQALFAAALDDQELFDALAREQTLRDLLRDPVAKAHLLAAIDDSNVVRVPWYRRYTFGLAVAAACAAALVAFVALRPAQRTASTVAAVRADQVKLLAQSETPPAGEPGSRMEERSASQPAGQAAGQPAGHASEREVKRLPRAKATGMAGVESFRPVAPVPGAPPLPTYQAAPLPAAATGIGAVQEKAQLAAAAPAAATGSLETAQAQAGQQGAQAGVGGVRSAAGGFLPQQSSQQAGQQGLRQNSQIQFATQRDQQQAGENLVIRAKQEPAGLAMFAGGGGGAGPLLAAPSAKVLRLDASGGFSEADGSNLHAGDTVKLSLIPAADGFLSLIPSMPGSSNFQPLINQPVERLKPIETQPFQQKEAGQREYLVVFSRTPQAVKKDEKAAASVLKTAAATTGAVSGGRGGGAGAANGQVSDANKAEAAHNASTTAGNVPGPAPGPLPLRMSQAPPFRIVLIYK